jgi:hypothetical protein
MIVSKFRGINRKENEMANWVDLTIEEISNLTPINEVDPKKALSIANSIIEGTFKSPDILFFSPFSAAVTGSHRIAAAKILMSLDQNSGFELGYRELEFPAIDIADEIDIYCEQQDCSFEDLPFDDLRKFLSGTEVEEDAELNEEW